ncbi:Mcm10p [Rhodotorula paludigena]|uniref:Mcm10p n=1 Tax=Rhodotorula paludigena TaxID=86838 RepID=UPI0031714238
MSSDGPSVEDLERELERARARRARKAAEDEARRASGPQELVPNSPSPRKKRRTEAEAAAAGSSARPLRILPKVAAPSFFDADPRARSLNPSDKVQLREGTKKRSQFVDHLSAVPVSFAERQAESLAVDRAKRERKQRQLERRAALASTGGGGGLGELSRASRDVLLGGKKGEVRLKERKKEVREEDGRETRRNSRESAKRSEQGDRRSEAAAPARSAASAMSRPTSTLSTADVKPSLASTKRPARAQSEHDDLEVTHGPSRRTRRKDGTIIEVLEMGPREFAAPKDDPEWKRVEPYSGIRLRERILPHAALDNLLDGRYHLTPSQVYALSHVDSRNRIEIDAEQVDSDFVVIGVLAWKDEVRFLNSNALGGARGDKGKERGKGGSDAESGSDDEKEEEEARGGKGKKRVKDEKENAGGGRNDPLYRPQTKRQRRQQYLRFELVDLSSTHASASATGRLSVMLVQADAVDKAVDEDGNEVDVYKGQSGGAYEKFWKESPGAVVAIVNPSFLPSNKNFSYTLKPTSADSMVVIGRADNLAFCEAIKVDGKRCGQWVDARTGKHCQFHVERAVKRTGVRRAETSSNTASMSQKGTFSHAQFARSLGTSSSSSSRAHQQHSSKPTSPPATAAAQVIYGSTTYVTRPSGRPGSTVQLPSSASSTSLLPSHSRGGFLPGLREGPVVSDEKKRLQRQAEDDKRARRELRALVGRDKGKTPGGEYLVRAKRGAAAASTSGSSDRETEGHGEQERNGTLAGIFKSDALRKIGYNPTARPGDVVRDESDEAKRHRLALEDGLANRKIDLSAPPGPKIRSVSAPRFREESQQAEGASTGVDADDDDDLVVEGGPALDRPKISLAKLKKK